MDTLKAINKLRSEMDLHSALFCFLPKRWNPSSVIRNLAWSKPTRWNPTRPGRIPTKAGVYAFLLIPNIRGAPPGVYVLYIGMTDKQGLHARYRQYAREMRDPRGRVKIRNMLTNWPKHLWYSYAVTPRDKAESAEKKLRAMLIPPFNYDIAADINAAKKAF